MADERTIDELVELLGSKDARVRIGAVSAAASITGDEKSAAYFRKTEGPELFLLSALRHDRKDSTAVQAGLAGLINLSGDAPGFIETLITRGAEIGLPVILSLLVALADPRTLFAELHAMFLCNVTRDPFGCKAFLGLAGEKAGSPSRNIAKMVDLLVFGEETAQSRAVQPWVAAVLENVTQVKEGRDVMLDAERAVLPAILPMVSSEKSVTDVRRGVLGVVKNCAFEDSAHNMLLGVVGTADDNSSQDDYPGSVVPFLLWPLRDSTVLPEKDDALLHKSLKNLAFVKTRKTVDSDRETRKRSLDGILLLTHSKAGRSALRMQGTYPVLRQYDVVENDEELKETVLQIVELLMMLEEDDGTVGGERPRPDTEATEQPKALTDSSTNQTEVPVAQQEGTDRAANDSAGSNEADDDDSASRAPRRVESGDIEEL